MDWPDIPQLFGQRTISAASIAKGSGNTFASSAWPTANKAFYFPISIRARFVLKAFFVCNGATASNNFDAGVYSADGTKITSTGSTAQAGTTDCQVVNVTDLVIVAGWYYLALAFNGTAGTVFRNVGFPVAAMKALGCAVQTTAFALPATATFATSDLAYLPLFGLLGDDAI